MFDQSVIINECLVDGENKAEKNLFFALKI